MVNHHLVVDLVFHLNICPTYGFFALLVIYAALSVYQLDPGERSVVLRLGKYHKEETEGLRFMLAGIDQRFVEDVALTRRYSQTANMLTQSENLVDVTVSVQYRISNLKDFVLNVRDPEASLKKELLRVLLDLLLETTLLSKH